MIKRSAVLPAGVLLVASVLGFWSCGGTAPKQVESTPVEPTANAAEINAPLSSFSQQIASSKKSLKMKPSETILIPIVVRNTGQELISAKGKFPVNVSYKWFEGGQMLPIEGERTFLPRPLKPNESADVDLKVVAPPSGKSLILKITLVQEGVRWFMIAGATPLEIPVTLVP